MVYGGRYKVERLLASGSMGDVFIARHTLTGQEVALKVLFSNVARNVGGVERFLTEIRTASAIAHEGAVRIMDAGEDHGTYYYAMELLEGESLDDWLRSQTRSLSQALGLVHQVLGALAEAHEKGIIHRDIKPENIFVARKKGDQLVAKLLDFGIARELKTTRMTQTGHTLGTPAYMSPEQATAPQNAGPASDVWSVGVLLYEIITGQVPFDADTPQAICIRSVCDPHAPISQWVAGVDPRLEALIDQCLEKNFKHRLPNAREVRNRLGQILNRPATGTFAAPKQPVVFLPPPTDLTSVDNTADALRSSALLTPVTRPRIESLASTPVPAFIDTNEFQALNTHTPTPPPIANNALVLEQQDIWGDQKTIPLDRHLELVREQTVMNHSGPAPAPPAAHKPAVKPPPIPKALKATTDVEAPPAKLAPPPPPPPPPPKAPSLASMQARIAPVPVREVRFTRPMAQIEPPERRAPTWALVLALVALVTIALVLYPTTRQHIQNALGLQTPQTTTQAKDSPIAPAQSSPSKHPAP